MKQFRKGILSIVCTLALLYTLVIPAQAADTMFYDCVLYLFGFNDVPEVVTQSVAIQVQAADGSGEYRIFGSDIDPKAVEISRANAERAGVADIVEFSVADAREFSRTTERGVIVTNPPYGERLMEKREAERLYIDFGKAFSRVKGWELCLLSSHTEFERCFGALAGKRRRLYNGMIRCELYIYKDGGSRR